MVSQGSPNGTAPPQVGAEIDPSLELERKKTEQAQQKLKEFLRSYAPAQHKGEKDVLGGRFKMNLAATVPEFSSDYATAYEAIDIADNNAPSIVKVMQPDRIQRYRMIERLQTIEHRAVNPVKGHGIVELSTQNLERFAVAYHKPQGIKLSEWVKKKRISLSPHYLLEHILIPIITGLEHFAALEISHGCINPDNIFYDGNSAMLGPCISGPCGFNQPFYFESVERIQSHPSAKGEGSTAHDYYALAVTLLYILHGPDHFAHFTRENLTMRILKEGAYHVLMRDMEVPEIFYDFLRGTLTQSPEDRWGEKQLKSWLGGKRFNVLPPPPPSEAVRPYEYHDIMVNNRRELAHLFTLDWNAMIGSIHNSQLSHWVTVSLRNKELAEMIARLCKGALEVYGKNDVQASEMLSNIVLLLDQLGPIRIRQTAFHVEAIDAMVIQMYQEKSVVELQFLAKFVETNMINYWLTMQSKRKPDFDINDRFNELVHRLERLRGYMRNSGHGFGIERMIYDLNPDMPCISPLLEARHVNSLPQLLRALDHKCLNLDGDEIIDRHISAYVASKLQIHNEIRLLELSSIPTLATNRVMLALYLLAIVQDRVDNMRLTGLSHWFAIQLMPLMDTIHSKSLRQKMKSMLVNVAPLGHLPKLADLLISADYAAADSQGFEKAVNTYRKNAAEIISLKQPERLERETHRMGLNLATMLAYGGLVFSVLYIIRELSS